MTEQPQERWTDPQAAAEFGLDEWWTLRNIRQAYPDWPWPPRPGRDRIWLREDLERMRPYIEDWKKSPTRRWVCAQCRRFTSNNRKRPSGLPSVGDCQVHGRQVPIVEAEMRYRGVKQQPESKAPHQGIDEVIAEATEA